MCSSCAATMQACDKTNGQCTCTPASCPDGCCSGSACVPYPNQGDSACGKSGAACAPCESGKYCDANGACLTSTWCKTQAIPSGIAAADYQCLDFDTGMPSTNIWMPTVKGESGTLELVTDQVRSVPNSLHSVAWTTNPELFPSDVAHLTWRASGNLISAVTLATDAYFTETYGGYPNGYNDYLCVTMGGTKACLSYRYPNRDIFAITFPTLSSPVPVCDVTVLIEYLKWSHVEMTLSNTGVVTLSVNGAPMTCSSGVAISSGASSVQIGAESISPNNWGDIRVDNVITYVRR
jgi:hypothetical protein